ncbi:MAG: glycoside hydrolase domain-containing protein [Armatimonadota bacterium]
MSGIRLRALVGMAALLLLSPANAALIVSEADPWQNVIVPNHEPAEGALAPPPAAPVERIHLRAARNEYECAALNLRNTGAETLYIRSGIRPGSGDLGGRPLQDSAQVVLREAVHLRNIRGALVADALPRLRPRQVMTLPAGELRQLWVEVHTADLAPGVYDLSLRLTPVDGGPVVEVPVRLHVWDFELPERMPVAVFNWDYGIRGRDEPLRSRYLRAMVEHGVNVFHISGSPKVVCNAEGELLEQPDFSGWDGLIALERPHAELFLLENWQFRGRPFETPDGEEIEYLSEAWVRAFEAWLPQLVAYMRSRGLDYEDWAFYPFDEYIGPDFVALARQVKRIDPRIQIFTDKLTDAEQVRAAAPYTDIWCPYDGHFGEQYAEGLRIMRESGKPIWFYFCGRDQKAFPPMERYRLMGWKTWARDLQGCTYWNIFGGGGSVWDDLDSTHPDPGSVYTGPDGPVTSRRWEAFRQGLEDYCYLWLLDRRLQRPGGDDATAQAILQAAAEDVLEHPDTATVEQWRRRIAGAILQLGREQQ